MLLAFIVRTADTQDLKEHSCGHPPHTLKPKLSALYVGSSWYGFVQQVYPSAHVGLVPNYCQYGVLYVGSYYNTGPYMNFPPFGNSDLGKLPCTIEGPGGRACAPYYPSGSKDSQFKAFGPKTILKPLTINLEPYHMSYSLNSLKGVI